MTISGDVKGIQGWRGGMMMRLVMIALLLMVAGGLAACGKRPGNVDLPDGVETDYGQHIYPDIATDPKP